MRRVWGRRQRVGASGGTAYGCPSFDVASRASYAGRSGRGPGLGSGCVLAEMFWGTSTASCDRDHRWEWSLLVPESGVMPLAFRRWELNYLTGFAAGKMQSIGTNTDLWETRPCSGRVGRKWSAVALTPAVDTGSVVCK